MSIFTILKKEYMGKFRLNQKRVFLIIFLTILGLLFFSVFLKKNSQQESAEKEEVGKEVFLERKAVPDEFPEDFPLPFESIVNESSVKNENNTVGVSLIITADMSLNQALNFFEDSLARNGWSYFPVSIEEESATFNFSKKGSQGFAGIVLSGNKVKIVVTIAVK